MGDYIVDDFNIWLSQPSPRLNQLKDTSSNGISNPPLPSQLNNPPSWLALPLPPSCVPSSSSSINRRTSLSPATRQDK